MTTRLSPTQQKAFDVLQHAYPIGNVFVLHGHAGMGKTTVLREVEHSHGGAFSDHEHLSRRHAIKASIGPRRNLRALGAASAGAARVRAGR